MKSKSILILIATLIIGFAIGFMTNSQLTKRRIQSFVKMGTSAGFKERLYRVIKPDDLQYKLYDKEYAVNLLDAAPDLGSATNRVYPLALGVVNLVQPLQVGGTTDYQYWKAGITETTPGTGVYQIYDNGSEKTITIDDQTTIFQSITKEVWLNGTSIESGISEEELVIVAGTGTPTDYAGVYVVTGTRTNGIKIRLRETQGYAAYTSGNTVNAVSVTSVDLIPGKPVGDMLMSGTGADTTLIDFFDWAKSRINTALTLSLTLNTSLASSVSISGYETQQKNLLDFMSEVSAACNHLFYIDENAGVIWLIDMTSNNGTLDFDEYGYFKGANYQYPDPIKSVAHKWEGNALSIDDQDYPIIIRQLQTQTIDFGVPVGRENVGVKVYHTVVANVISQMKAISTSQQAPTTTLPIPFQSGIVPGLKITFTDSNFPTASDVECRVRTIQFDPSGEQIKVGVHVI